MVMLGSGTDGLVSIRGAADHFGVPISTLHYWERCGLVESMRRGGVRYYGTEQLYRIALVKLWRDTGQLSIGEIATVLAGESPWRETVAERLAEVEERMAALDAARSYLRYLLTCSRETGVERCPAFRDTVELPAG